MQFTTTNSSSPIPIWSNLMSSNLIAMDLYSNSMLSSPASRFSRRPVSWSRNPGCGRYILAEYTAEIGRFSIGAVVRGSRSESWTFEADTVAVEAVDLEKLRIFLSHSFVLLSVFRNPRFGILGEEEEKEGFLGNDVYYLRECRSLFAAVEPTYEYQPRSGRREGIG
ncbi:hypothetical protein LINPERPRIM_LOCUS18941 [Linum perenne]